MKDLSSHLLDIVQNSIRAGAKLTRIEISEMTIENRLMLVVSDNGKGMTNEELAVATDPFYTSRSTRKVGLGLSLLKQKAEMTGGTFELESEPGVGTKVAAGFAMNHFDRPALGDLVGTLLLLIGDAGDTDYVFQHKTANGLFEMDTREIKKALGDVSFSHPVVRKFLKEMIEAYLEQIQISEC